MKVLITNEANPIGRLFAKQPSIKAEARHRKLAIVEELLQRMEKPGISRGELARRMEVQPSGVTSMLSGSNNFTIETLVRAGRAFGADIELHFVPSKSAVDAPQTPEFSPTARAEKPSPVSSSCSVGTL